ncbi:MAG: dienelactone hydrolase family protein [Gemmatimonadaceae bacterium]|nr:dienelactone hydrolase family protein [Gemmatimonadaceae bacterium]
MTDSEWRIPVGDGEVSAVYEPATGALQRAVFVCAHGAGGSMSDRGMLASAQAMRNAGFGVVRFNFPYKERQSGRPDAMPLLMETVAATVAFTRQQLSPGLLVIGGRSMGGRATSMLAADGFAADGLLLLAYPLHPAGQPEKLRDAHLSRICMPVLCVNGTRDTLCTPELMTRALTSVIAPWQMHWVEGADHSFHVLKSSGRTDAMVMTEIGTVATEWLAALTNSRP